MRKAAIGALCAVLLTGAVASANGVPALRSAGAPAAPRAADAVEAAPRSAGALDRGSAAAAPAAVSTGPLYLYFEREPVGIVTRMEGCTRVGIVTSRDMGNSQVKDVTGSEMARCALTLSFGMGRQLKSWLRNELNGRAQAAMTISIVRANGARVATGGLALLDAHLTGLIVGDLNAAIQNKMTLAIELTVSDSARHPGTDYQSATSWADPKLFSDGFQVTVGESGQPLVSAVSGIRMTREAPPGEPIGPWVVKDLTVETTRAGGTVWDESYANNIGGSSDERSVRIDLLRSSTVVGATFMLGGVGVYGADGNVDSPVESIARRTFAAYVETVDLQIP